MVRLDLQLLYSRLATLLLNLVLISVLTQDQIVAISFYARPC